MSKQILTVVGARPQFIKAATVSRAIAASSSLHERMIHTGQHFDHNMSEVFFSELGIPEPAINLGAGGGTHGAATGRMLADIEAVLLQDRPAAVLVYGDTNSTLAGALAAAKLHIPIAHVEAGLRSFNRNMPEETNRVLTDHMSHWLFCPTTVARDLLGREGITAGVSVVGDVMFDAVRFFHDPEIHSEPDRPYIACTLHRAENVDDEARLSSILGALGSLPQTVRLPLHPRTKARMESFKLEFPENFEILEPQPYQAMLRLIAGSSLVVTDSGGLQKEAHFLGKPCVTTRTETEWTELVDAGVNVLADADPKRINAAVERLFGQQVAALDAYGDGRAAEKIVAVLESQL